MPDIYTAPLDNTRISHFKSMSENTNMIYLGIILLMVLAVLALPFIKMDISVSARGIIRPISERADIRSAIPGAIKEIFVKDGAFVKKNDILFAINDSSLIGKRLTINKEIHILKESLHDLKLLINTGGSLNDHLPGLKSAVFRSQQQEYLSRRYEWRADIKKIKHQLYLHEQLSRDAIIAENELFEKKVEYEKMIALFNSFEAAQISEWTQLSIKYAAELEQLLLQQLQLKEEEKSYRIRAPVSGNIQDPGNKYPGSVVSAGELLCHISPEAMLIAECWVTAADIGLLNTGMPSVFSIDAFNRHYFGNLPGKILSIDKDFTMIEGKPMFKIKCSFDKSFRQAKDFIDRLKKGMTLDARFITAQRSLWQLLYDRTSDWLDPGIS